VLCPKKECHQRRILDAGCCIAAGLVVCLAVGIAAAAVAPVAEAVAPVAAGIAEAEAEAGVSKYPS